MDLLRVRGCGGMGDEGKGVLERRISEVCWGEGSGWAIAVLVGERYEVARGK